MRRLFLQSVSSILPSFFAPLLSVQPLLLPHSLIIPSMPLFTSTSSLPLSFVSLSPSSLISLLTFSLQSYHPPSSLAMSLLSPACVNSTIIALSHHLSNPFRALSMHKSYLPCFYTQTRQSVCKRGHQQRYIFRNNGDFLQKHKYTSIMPSAPVKRFRAQKDLV